MGMNMMLPDADHGTKRQRRKWAICLAMMVLAIAAAFGTGSILTQAAHVPQGHLVDFGPTDPNYGYPTWYQDAGLRDGAGNVLLNPVTLELCLEVTNPWCLLEPSFDPNQPLVIRATPEQSNFPIESFYWTGDGGMDTSAGRAVLVLALEAALAAEIPIDGDQMVFGRVRHVFEVPLTRPAGAVYTVTHPYGVDVITPADIDDRGKVFVTQDIGTAPLDFAGAFKSRIGPFLRWAPNPLNPADVPPAGWIGNPDIPHAVVGSPFGTNFYRIVGPGIWNNDPQFACGDLLPAGVAPSDCIATRLLSVMGKIATRGGVEVNRATYSRTAAQGFVDVFARSLPNQNVRVLDPVAAPAVPAFESTQLIGNAAGRYVGRVSFSGAPPANISVINASDVPTTVKGVRLVDQVTITQADAQYNLSTGLFTVTVSALSSDEVTPPGLTLVGFGPLSQGAPTSFAVPMISATVSVTSTAGGSDTAGIHLLGPVTRPPMPFQVFLGPVERTVLH